MVQNKSLRLHQQNIITNLQKLLPSVLFLGYTRKNTLIIGCTPADFFFILNFLKLSTFFQYNLLTSITGVDYLDRQNRFEIIYELLSIRYNSRINVKIFTNEIMPVRSIVPIFSAATWWEREIWDLFGVFFEKNDEIKRILTDYGFEGHPLRKDFPLSGYIEVRYNDKLKRVICESLEHAQIFRNYNFGLGW